MFKVARGEMPCIRSPPQRTRAGSVPTQSVAKKDVDFEEENENQAPLGESTKGNKPVVSSLQQAKQKAASAAAMTKRNGPQITVLPDTRTRIWELEGEISKLERDKRFLDEERRKLGEEKDAEMAEMKLHFEQQLDSERRRAQKELEASNAQWREEVEESNRRHERREKELERKLGQAKDMIKADLDAEYTMRIEQLERERNRLKTQVEVLETDLKEMEQYRSRCEETDRQLRETKESHARALVSIKESTDAARKDLLDAHAQELVTAIEAAKAELRLTQAREMNDALERSRQELRQAHQRAVDALEAEVHAMQSKYDKEVQAYQERIRHEHEEKAHLVSELQSRAEHGFGETKEMRERMKVLSAQNESLRAQLRQEHDERIKEERKRAVEMEMAQQRTDEAVARALSIVKRTEDKMSLLAKSSSTGSSTSLSTTSSSSTLRGRSGRDMMPTRMAHSMEDDTPFEIVAITRPIPPPPPSRYVSSSSTSRRASVPSLALVRSPPSEPSRQSEQRSFSMAYPSRTNTPTRQQQRASSPGLMQHRGRASSAGHVPNYLGQTHSSQIRSSTSPTDYDTKGRRFV